MKSLIYGATRGRGEGIGRAVALQLLRRGHQVNGLYRDAGENARRPMIHVEAIDLDPDRTDLS